MRGWRKYLAPFLATVTCAVAIAAGRGRGMYRHATPTPPLATTEAQDIPAGRNHELV
jgi:hypothetical protein